MVTAANTREHRVASEAATRLLAVPAAKPTNPGQLAVGTSIGGRYRVLAAIGEGMSGVVYRARQESLDRDVAVKVLHPDRSHDPEFVERFRAEARIASAISDQHITAIYDFGEHEGCLYLVMELVAGHSLGDEIDRGVAEPSRVRDLMLQILDGLAAIHKAGVVHADLKPDNAIIARTPYSPERVVLIDFGIARIEPRTSSSGRRSTRQEMVAGTPGYIAPEVISGETPSPAADLYAAGVILFELLTGRAPYASSQGGIELMRQHVCNPIPDPATVRPELPEACSEICRRALAKAPADRYASVEEFRQAVATMISPTFVDRSRAGTVDRRAQTAPTLRFVGRHDEQRFLVELFEGTSPHGAMRLAGSNGSGRSRLVQRAAALAHPANPRIVFASADETGCRAIYEPILSLLASSYALPASHTREELAETILAEVGKTPELAALREMIDGGGHLSSLDPIERRQLVLYSVVSLVERTIDARTTLVFDDAHEYDEASREIVAALARRVPAAGGRVLIVTEPQDDLLGSLHQVSLGPLDEAALAEMAQCIGGETTTVPSIEALIRLGGHQPAHLAQIARRLIEGDSTLPVSFFDLVRARTAELTPDLVAMLQLLSVMGRAARVREVVTMLRTGCAGAYWPSTESVEETLLDAERAGMLAIHDGMVRFVCSAVRDAIYASILVEQRAIKHRVILDHSGPEVPLAVCAWHAVEGERDREAAIYQADAAARAARFFDRGAALQHYRAAFAAAQRAHSEATPAGALMERAGVGLARAYIDHGLTDAAVAVLGALCGPHGDAHEPQAWSPEVIETWARLAFLRGDAADAIRALNEQIRSSDHIDGEQYVAWARCIGEFLCELRGPAAAAHTMRVAARELQARTDDSGPSWRLLLLAADYHTAASESAEARECAVAACAEASATGDAAAMWRSRMALAAAVEAAGQPGDGAPHREQAALAFARA